MTFLCRFPLLVGCFSVIPSETKLIICAIFGQYTTISPKQHLVQVHHIFQVKSCYQTYYFFLSAFFGGYLILITCFSVTSYVDVVEYLFLKTQAGFIIISHFCGLPMTTNASQFPYNPGTGARRSLKATQSVIGSIYFTTSSISLSLSAK